MQHAHIKLYRELGKWNEKLSIDVHDYYRENAMCVDRIARKSAIIRIIKKGRDLTQSFKFFENFIITLKDFRLFIERCEPACAL